VLVSFLCIFACMLYLFLVNVRSRKLILLLLSSFVMLKDRCLPMLLMLVSNCSSCIFLCIDQDDDVINISF